MNTSTVTRFTTRIGHAMLALGILGSAASHSFAQDGHSHMDTMKRGQSSNASALLKIVRDSTERFKDVLVAPAAGTQGYICLPTSAGAATASWTVKPSRPQATLFQRVFGQEFQIATHFLSPDANPNNLAPSPASLRQRDVAELTRYQQGLGAGAAFEQHSGGLRPHLPERRLHPLPAARLHRFAAWACRWNDVVQKRPSSNGWPPGAVLRRPMSVLRQRILEPRYSSPIPLITTSTGRTSHGRAADAPSRLQAVIVTAAKRREL